MSDFTDMQLEECENAAALAKAYVEASRPVTNGPTGGEGNSSGDTFAPGDPAVTTR